jgi:hypothetical protein
MPTLDDEILADFDAAHLDDIAFEACRAHLQDLRAVYGSPPAMKPRVSFGPRGPTRPETRLPGQECLATISDH